MTTQQREWKQRIVNLQYLDDGIEEACIAKVWKTLKHHTNSVVTIDNYIKYSLDFLCPIKTTEAFEAVDWLADLPQQTWPQAGHR